MRDCSHRTFADRVDRRNRIQDALTLIRPSEYWIVEADKRRADGSSWKSDKILFVGTIVSWVGNFAKCFVDIEGWTLQRFFIHGMLNVQNLVGLRDVPLSPEWLYGYMSD